MGGRGRGRKERQHRQKKAPASQPASIKSPSSDAGGRRWWWRMELRHPPPSPIPCPETHGDDESRSGQWQGARIAMRRRQLSRRRSGQRKLARTGTGGRRRRRAWHGEWRGERGGWRVEGGGRGPLSRWQVSDSRLAHMQLQHWAYSRHCKPGRTTCLLRCKPGPHLPVT